MSDRAHHALSATAGAVSTARPEHTRTLTVLSAMTLRKADFARRIDAAARAGFGGIGLRISDYLEARAQGWSDIGMKGLLADRGIKVTEVELLRSWGVPQGPASREEEDNAFRIAHLFGARCVNAGIPDGVAENDLAREYSRLCRRAAESGLMVPLEFMPYGAVTSLAQADRIVTDAGQPNGGLLIDTWHCHRTGVGADDLAALPADRVISIQICDAQPTPLTDLREEARHLRRLPGEGVADITGALRALAHSTRVASVAVEIMSDALDRIPSDVAAKLAHRATGLALTKGGWN